MFRNPGYATFTHLDDDNRKNCKIAFITVAGMEEAAYTLLGNAIETVSAKRLEDAESYAQVFHFIQYLVLIIKKGIEEIDTHTQLIFIPYIKFYSKPKDYLTLSDSGGFMFIRNPRDEQYYYYCYYLCVLLKTRHTMDWNCFAM